MCWELDQPPPVSPGINLTGTKSVCKEGQGRAEKATRCFSRTDMHLLCSLFIILVNGSRNNATIAERLPYLHQIASATAELLLGKGYDIPLNTGHFDAAKIRTLRGRNIGSLVSRNILVSYRYPRIPASQSDLYHLLESLDSRNGSLDSGNAAAVRAPLRLLEDIEEQRKISPPDSENYNDFRAAAAQVVARNMVLARLFLRIVENDDAPEQKLIGLQQHSESFPFLTSYLSGLHMEVLTVPSSFSLKSVRGALKMDSLVEEVWEDEIIDGDQGSMTRRDQAYHVPPTLHYTSNDEFFFKQWPFHAGAASVGNPAVWASHARKLQKQKTLPDVTIALIDSGVEMHHPDLRGQLWINSGEKDCHDGIDDDGNGYIDDCYGWVGSDSLGLLLLGLGRGR